VRSIVMAVAAVALIAGAAMAQEKKPEFKYVGASGCKACHMAPTTGAAYKIWSESPHAKAFEVLATPAALEIAKKKGIADPQKSNDCLKCHVTAPGAAPAKLEATFKPNVDGVSCESCHGPGSGYKAMATMKGIAAKTTKAEDVGLTIPSEKTCVTCHNAESPTFKGFKYAEAFPKIAHPKPKKP
jgi:cytochrome c5